MADTADVLLELMYSWIKQRERCAEQLKKLAKELESRRLKCNISESVGSSVSVVGAATMIGAGVATLFTGGLAAPLFGLGAVYTGVGTTISVATKITEHFLSSRTMEKAREIEKKSNEIADKIQRWFEKLKEEIKKARSLTDPDEVDQHVMTEILRAMGRRSGLHGDIGESLLDKLQFFFHKGLGNVRSNLISLQPDVMVGVAGIFAFFTFEVGGKKSKLLVAKGTEELIKVMSTSGLKTALKGGTMVVGGAVGMAFALPEAIDNWKEMIENNYVTEASQSLRDTAKAILEMTRTLKKKLDRISSSYRQTLEMLAEMERCIENSDRSSEEKQKLREFVLKMLEHKDFVKWLKGLSESESESSKSESIKLRCQTTVELGEMVNFLEQALDKEKEKIVNKDNLHITFVAHGAIEQTMIPANTLLPQSTIKDVVLYSPWNCAINAGVAYGVATGIIKPQHRAFCCTGEDNCQIPDEGHRPTNLPNRWNSMQRAAAEGQMIPNIIVSPLRIPEDGAWKRFLFLQKEYGRPGTDRIVIPFILSRHSDAEVPLSVVTLALSQVLKSSSFKATVHLAACLGKSSDETTRYEGYLKKQYACTIDSTAMISSDDMLIDTETDLYRALYEMFG